MRKILRRYGISSTLPAKYTDDIVVRLAAAERTNAIFLMRRPLLVKRTQPSCFSVCGAQVVVLFSFVRIPYLDISGTPDPVSPTLSPMPVWECHPKGFDELSS